MTPPDPDAALVARVGAGDVDAMRHLVARKLPRILALATRMLGDRTEAEDVAQDCFTRVWRHAARWRTGDARFDTWLHRVAMNLCRDRLRRRRAILVPELPDGIDPAPLPDVALDDVAAADRMARALAGLAPRQREAIVLTYYQSLSNIDAATVMAISVDALESLLSRGRRSLRATLAEEDA
ncbi:MAG TPA: RNA polymerase sigma factor [Sphingomonas sp.]|uniref:RNA polymerase sigma factor n=1 Tax=Sphingomonas sp. TaxID=28214 RepID=UPI002ED8D2B1